MLQLLWSVRQKRDDRHKYDELRSNAVRRVTAKVQTDPIVNVQMAKIQLHVSINLHMARVHLQVAMVQVAWK